MGGKSFGINLKTIGKVSIPRLAEGAYVKANQPQLAVVGDNRRYGEIIAPENKLADVYRKVNKENGQGINKEVVDLLKTIIELLKSMGFDFNLYIDSYELNKRLEKTRKKVDFARNGG